MSKFKFQKWVFFNMKCAISGKILNKRQEHYINVGIISLPAGPIKTHKLQFNCMIFQVVMTSSC